MATGISIKREANMFEDADIIPMKTSEHHKEAPRPVHVRKAQSKSRKKLDSRTEIEKDIDAYLKKSGPTIPFDAPFDQQDPTDLKNYKWKCPNCVMYYAHKGSLKTHMFTHTKQKHRYYCHRCSAKFPTRHMLRSHDCTALIHPYTDLSPTDSPIPSHPAKRTRLDDGEISLLSVVGGHLGHSQMHDFKSIPNEEIGFYDSNSEGPQCMPDHSDDNLEASQNSSGADTSFDGPLSATLPLSVVRRLLDEERLGGPNLELILPPD
eukprot:355227_1